MPTVELSNMEKLGEKSEISVVIPAFNEELRLPRTLSETIPYLRSHFQNFEVLVVNDGSVDGTSDLVRRISLESPEVRLIELAHNMGKGAAVRTGMSECRFDLAIFLDADGSTPISELAKLTAAISEGYDMAIGSRALASDSTSVTTKWYRKYLGRMFNFCVNLLIVPGIADTQCGFKLFKKDCAKFLFATQKSDGFSFDVEILYLARKAGFRIKEIPINWTNVAGSKVNLVVDAAKMFRDVFRFRAWHRHIKRAKG